MENTQTLVSTTDTPEAVRAALGVKEETPPAVVPPKADEPPAVTPPAAAAPPPTDADPDPDPDAAASEAGRVLAGRKNRIHARIDELTREKYESKREADEAKREAATLREKLAKLESGKPPAAGEPPSAETAPAPPVEVAPPITGEDPADPKPDFDNYENVADFTLATAEWATRKQERKASLQAAANEKVAAQKAAQTAADAQRQDVLTKYFENRDKVKVKYPDWDEVMAKAEIPIPQELEFEILSSPHNAELLYYFGKNVGELDEIIKGTKSAGLRKLGVLEARFAAEAETAAPTAATPPAANQPPATRPVPVSSAPEPVTTVGGGSTATSKPMDQMDYQEFKRARQAAGTARR